MGKTVMAIGGHVGDMELTCGGILATLAEKGYEVITVALTGGERGNPAGVSVEEYRKQKEKEAAAFAEALGGKAIVLPYLDGELPDSDEVRYEVCDLIREYKPEYLFTHWKNSMHKDHERTHRIVKGGHFLASLGSLERKDKAHFAKGPFYADNWEDPEGFVPEIYMEVTETGFKKWQEAIKFHWFAMNSKDFPYYEFYSHYKRCNGCLCKKAYAERFMVNYESKKRIMTLE